LHPSTHTAAETESSCLSAVIPNVYTAIVWYTGGNIRWKVSSREKEKSCIL